MRKNKLFLLLALLLTAATGAWADGVTMKEITGSDIQSSWNGNTDPVKATDLPGFKAMTHDEAIALGAPSNNEKVYLIYAINASNKFAALIYDYGTKSSYETEFNLNELQRTAQDYWVYYTYSDAPAAAATYTVSLKDGVKDADKWSIEPKEGLSEGDQVTLQYNGRLKVKGVKATSDAAATETYPLLSAATTADVGKVVCAAGHLHDAKTAVPSGCTAVGIIGKVTETGHGLILALQNAPEQTWNTINGWTSVTTYAGTTLKVLPDDAARGTNLTSYTTLGSTTVSNWAVAQKSDYMAIFTNLGSTMTGNWSDTTYDANVNAYITTGVGGSEISGIYWSATDENDSHTWFFYSDYWNRNVKTNSYSVRPVIGF